MRGGSEAPAVATAASAYAAITALARGRTRTEVLYTLDTDSVTGLFAVDGDTLEETRLFHGNHRRIGFPAARPEEDRIACSQWGGDGSSHLVVMRGDGSHPVSVTEGETVDLAPSWIPGHPGELVYQSAGIARTNDGMPTGLGPVSVCRLDLEHGIVTTVLEAPTCDFLSPRIDADGALHYIRRPYRSGEPTRPLRVAVDFLAFPYRLLVAVFHWLNFFGVRYTGRPLITPRGAKAKEADARRWLLWGNIIDAAADQRRGASEDGNAPGLVPRSWVLECRRLDGDVTLMARGVSCFDLDEDGVVYSDGSAIYRLGKNGERRRLASAPRIGSVASIG
jgi:hypothetical protein